MKITILLFGIVTDIIESQNNSIEMNISKKINLKDLKDLLLTKYPKLENFSDFAFAVNETYENENFIVSNNDIIAIIPPVSGG